MVRAGIETLSAGKNLAGDANGPGSGGGWQERTKSEASESRTVVSVKSSTEKHRYCTSSDSEMRPSNHASALPTSGSPARPSYLQHRGPRDGRGRPEP